MGGDKVSPRAAAALEMGTEIFHFLAQYLRQGSRQNGGSKYSVHDCGSQSIDYEFKMTTTSNF